MSRKPDPLGPYATPEELAKGTRRAALMLVIGAAALVLAVVARRYVDDEALVRTYLVAGALHLLAGIGLMVRISRTGDLERAE